MVTRLTFDNLRDLYGPFEQFRQLFLQERPRPGTPTHAALYDLVRDGHAVVALSAYGYVLVHTGAWQDRPVLMLDELFIHSQARKQGHLKELVEWLQGYCIFNGLSTCIMNTYGAEEARPLQVHLGAQSVSMLMHLPIPLDAPLYRSTYRPPVMVPPQVQPGPEHIPLPKKRVRTRKKKAAAEVWKDAAIVMQDVPPMQQAVRYESNVVVPNGSDGFILPRPAERM